MAGRGLGRRHAFARRAGAGAVCSGRLAQEPPRPLGSFPPWRPRPGEHWSVREFLRSDHFDARVRQRLLIMGKAWHRAPGSDLPTVLPRRAARKAAYRLPPAGQPARDHGRHPATPSRGRRRALRPGDHGAAGPGYDHAELRRAEELHRRAGAAGRDVEGQGRPAGARRAGAGGRRARAGRVLAAAAGALGGAQDPRLRQESGERALAGRLRAGRRAGRGGAAGAGAPAALAAHAPAGAGRARASRAHRGARREARTDPAQGADGGARSIASSCGRPRGAARPSRCRPCW